MRTRRFRARPASQPHVPNPGPHRSDTVSDKTPALVLNAKEERRIIRGHLWAYRNEFSHIPEGLADGQVVDVLSDAKRFVGRGFFQAEGGIAVRILSRHQRPMDPDFFAARLGAARALRARLFPGSDVYRWVYGESDGLPGLVADRYGDIAVVKATSKFYAEHADTIAAWFAGEGGLTGIVFEQGGWARRLGEVPETLALDVDGVRAELRPEGAQKTGLFLDQRSNWPVARLFAPGARVFDGHCYHGFWSCHAALAGAASVTAVDSSEKALDQARRNLELNGVAEKCELLCGEVETLLSGDAAYDLIILDPPAFAKTRAHATKALGRYQALNAAALKRIAPEGGFLITSSCSHFVDEAMFIEAVKRAAMAAGRTVRLLELRAASPDHPVLLSMLETSYLKCAVLRVD